MSLTNSTQGGSVVKLIIWAKLVTEDASDEGCSGRSCYVQITMNSLDAKGHGDSRSGAMVRPTNQPTNQLIIVYQ